MFDHIDIDDRFKPETTCKRSLDKYAHVGCDDANARRHTEILAITNQYLEHGPNRTEEKKALAEMNHIKCRSKEKMTNVLY